MVAIKPSDADVDTVEEREDGETADNQSRFCISPPPPIPLCKAIILDEDEDDDPSFLLFLPALLMLLLMPPRVLLLVLFSRSHILTTLSRPPVASTPR